MSGLGSSWKSSSSSSPDYTLKTRAVGRLSGSHSLEDMSPGMPSGPHLPAYSLPAHAGQPLLRSLGPFLLPLLSPHLAQDAGAQGHVCHPSAHPSGVRDMADFPIFHFSHSWAS